MSTPKTIETDAFASTSIEDLIPSVFGSCKKSGNAAKGAGKRRDLLYLQRSAVFARFMCERDVPLDQSNGGKKIIGAAFNEARDLIGEGLKMPEKTAEKIWQEAKALRAHSVLGLIANDTAKLVAAFQTADSDSDGAPVAIVSQAQLRRFLDLDKSKTDRQKLVTLFRKMGCKAHVQCHALVNSDAFRAEINDAAKGDKPVKVDDQTETTAEQMAA